MFSSIISNISGIAILIGSGYYIFKQFKSTSFEVSFTSVKEKYVLSIFLYLYIAILHISISILALAVSPKIVEKLGNNIIYWLVLSFILITISFIVIVSLEKKMSERVNYLTCFKNIENETKYNEVSKKLFRNASSYTTACIAVVFFSVSILYISSPNSFFISNLKIDNNYDELIVFINAMIIVFLATVFNIGKLNMLSKIKKPKLMDIKINGVLAYTKVILINNTEEFYFFKKYYTDREFSISKNQNIEIHRNYESIYIKEEPLTTKNNKNIIKKKMSN